jgi:hypothetical protein
VGLNRRVIFKYLCRAQYAVPLRNRDNPDVDYGQKPRTMTVTVGWRKIPRQ